MTKSPLIATFWKNVTEPALDIVKPLSKSSLLCPVPTSELMITLPVLPAVDVAVTVK